jgi:magnesium chelatase family protein
VVVVSRLKRTRRFPAQFLLVAAMNPCPCGYAGDSRGRCHCTAGQIVRYRNRISGPLVDRIDMHVELMALPADDLVPASSVSAETSATIAARVAAARDLQLARQGKLNGRLNTREVADVCALGGDARSLLATAIARMGLSARAYHRVLKLARTCADLGAAPNVRFVDVAEAIKLRALDRPTC